MYHHYQHERPTIGVLAGWQFYRTATNLSYLKPVFHGINQAAQDLGCNILFGCGMGASASSTDPIRPAWPIPASDVDHIPISPLNTDGLIVFNPLHSAARSQYIQDLIHTGHPVLFIGSGEPGQTLVADNSGGIFEAVHHLVDHGHRRIAFLAGSLEDMGGDTGERLKAYQSCIKQYGLESDSRIVAFGRHVYDGGYSAMRQIIESGVSFTAIVCSNDEMALGAMKALNEAGLRIPQDVAVIGFDNRLEGAANDPALSSIHVPLFEMGYRAVDLLLRRIDVKEEPTGTFSIGTRLIVRESCGCGEKHNFPQRSEAATPSLNMEGNDQRAKLVETISSTILSQAQSLKQDECMFLCQRLVDTFFYSVEQNDRAEFQRTLLDVLNQTATSEDGSNIWHDALSLLWSEFTGQVAASSKLLMAYDILDEARQTINAQMKRQHHQYVANQRWTSSRLSLLTASLITALDEDQIFEILAQHLPEMDIHFGHIVLFEEEENHSMAWSTVRNIFDLNQPPIRFPTQEFPPEGMFDQQAPYTLALIPLVHQAGQLGFAVFGTEHLDLYGSIVQQIAGALNTTLLYRQAIEGRRLAEEANRMKSRFLSTISHELRTPLNLILGLSGMLLRESDESDAPLPEPTRKDIDRIHAYSQHLGGLIGDVIDLAVSDAGQLRLNFEYVDIGQALRLVAESGSQLAADKGLAWEANLPESGPWVWGDQTRLRQVLLNLINNAVKFTTSGSVYLRLVENSDTVSITVQDTGLGIPLDEQQTIFDEFRQSERSIERGYGGLGLGLAISKRLIDLHGGTITVHSTGEEGTGSAFSFTLPTVKPSVGQDQSLDRILPAEPSVLVFTNHPSTSERLCESLRQRGFNVQVALIQSGFDWRLQLGKQPPDTIILDVSTDPALGWQVLKEIKGSQTLSGIPVMFFSTSQFAGSLLEMDYLTKPIEISELAKALDQHWLMMDASRAIRNILVVDDEPDTLEMHARVVQAHSASNQVLKARNGKEALELLRHEIVDLVLLDLQMPEMDGFEVLEAMRTVESTSKIPVIVVTGKILTETEMERLNQGVAAVLAKGLFSIEETIGHISTALEQKRRISAEAKRLVRLAMVYLQKNYSEPISRRDIAKHIGITEDHLTYCFRQELGITPIHYLQRYRINQAKRLLKESNQTITEIAFNVGFSDSGYFSRIFRREIGMSPEMFRQTSP
jgi:signal transduction histidine kinase/DNA-binding LacI/PurR family transcriptional regulator/CheY-like chemotaxis protein